MRLISQDYLAILFDSGREGFGGWLKAIGLGVEVCCSVVATCYYGDHSPFGYEVYCFKLGGVAY